jgi:hypothetical protein
MHWRNFKFALLLTTFVAVCTGHASGQKNDISEFAFASMLERASEALEKSSYREMRKLERFGDRSRAGTITESSLKEVLRLEPPRWRTVEERLVDGKKDREERLWDGKALYTRKNDGPWQKFAGGTSVSRAIESGTETTRYRYMGRVDLDGKPADLYESDRVRIANKFTQNDLVVVRFVRYQKLWYSLDGRLVKSVQEDAIEGVEGLSRETVTIEYDPKITIEAPIP